MNFFVRDPLAKNDINDLESKNDKEFETYSFECTNFENHFLKYNFNGDIVVEKLDHESLDDKKAATWIVEDGK